MNPFMERTWSDVHLRIISYILDSLGLVLPGDLQAKGELQVTVLGEPGLVASLHLERASLAVSLRSAPLVSVLARQNQRTY